jgi:hypothetical protein
MLGLAAVLGGCNFRPMLLAKGADDTSVSADLAAIEIRGPDDRLGYMVRNALLDRINPQSLPVPARYVLNLRLRSRESKLGIQIDRRREVRSTSASTPNFCAKRWSSPGEAGRSWRSTKWVLMRRSAKNRKALRVPGLLRMPKIWTSMAPNLHQKGA